MSCEQKFEGGSKRVNWQEWRGRLLVGTGCMWELERNVEWPGKWLRDHKFWPVVGRIDNVFGDRNLVCSCLGMEAYSA